MSNKGFAFSLFNWNCHQGDYLSLIDMWVFLTFHRIEVVYATSNKTTIACFHHGGSGDRTFFVGFRDPGLF